jgi:hypothetical protein
MARCTRPWKSSATSTVVPNASRTAPTLATTASIFAGRSSRSSSAVAFIFTAE